MQRDDDQEKHQPVHFSIAKNKTKLRPSQSASADTRKPSSLADLKHLDKEENPQDHSHVEGS